eukprot:1002984_1
MKTKTYKSDHERVNDEDSDSEDDEVIIKELRQEIEAKGHAIKALEAQKLTQQKRTQELQNNAQDIPRLQQQLEIKTRVIRDLEADKVAQNKQIQSLQTNITNIASDQDHTLVRLKESLSLPSNDNLQRFAWHRSEDDEK